MLYEGYAQFPGTIRDGRIVLADDVQLPDGLEVVVVVKPLEFTPEERAEFEWWERLGDHSWQMIDQWEREDAAG